MKRTVSIFMYMGDLTLLAVGDDMRRRDRGMDHVGVDDTFVDGRCDLDNAFMIGGVLLESDLHGLVEVR